MRSDEYNLRVEKLYNNGLSILVTERVLHNEAASLIVQVYQSGGRPY